MTIVVDMNLSPAWIPVLREAGWNAVHWIDIGDPRASDATILRWALANEAVVFTHDLDFGALLAAMNTNGPSVLQVRTQDVLPDVLAETVLAALAQFADALSEGALVTIDESRTRARLLPIRRPGQL